jgi:hypothetical protein
MIELTKNRRRHCHRRLLEAENLKISERTHRGIKAIAFNDIYEANLLSRRGEYHGAKRTNRHPNRRQINDFTAI